MQLIVNYSEPTFKVENGIYNGEYPKSLFFVSRGQFSLSVSELTGQPKLTAFQLMAIEGKRFSDSSIIVDGVEYAIDYTDESTVAGTLEVMYLILSSAFNGVEAEVPNIFTFTTAPSLQDFATTLGISLIYPTKKGEVIAFWNKDYVIPPTTFENSNLVSIRSIATDIGNPSFANSIYLEYSIFPSVKTIDNNAFKSCTSAKGFTFGVSLTQLGTTTGNDEVFGGISGNTIKVTIPIYFQTNDGGAMDGDLVYLDSNNTVTFNWI